MYLLFLTGTKLILKNTNNAQKNITKGANNHSKYLIIGASYDTIGSY